MRHPVKPTSPQLGADRARQRDDPLPPVWPNFTGTSFFLGTSSDGRVTVFSDPATGEPGYDNAVGLFNDADRVGGSNDDIFGTKGGHVSVIVYSIDGATDGSGGADHRACDFRRGAAIEVCTSFGRPDRVSALFEAELSECAMGGNLCGVSTGEALSRWCALVVSNNALPDFATAPTWAEMMPDFVNYTAGTDQNDVATGCGMAFISWLLSLGNSFNNVARTLVSLGQRATLADLYSKLTGDVAASALPNFLAAIRALAGGVKSDDPFNAAPKPIGLPILATGAAAGKPSASGRVGVSVSPPTQEIAAGGRSASGAPYSRRLQPPSQAGRLPAAG